MEWPRLRDEVRVAAARVGGLLRAFPVGSAPLARVTWSAAETGAHLVGLPGRYLRMAEARTPFPASLAEENQSEIDAVADREPARLADELQTEVAALLTALPDAGQRVWYFTVEQSAYGLCASMLSELLLHGADLARALGRPWPITRTQAVACLRGVLPAVVLLVDRSAARGADGTYHLRLRGDDDWTLHVHDGAVRVELGRPPRADVRISVDPVGFLLSSVGLASRLGAWPVVRGRRLWLMPRFGRLFARI